jgi:predicted choloylglycine hydrolase
MRKRFVFARENEPGEAWRARLVAGRAEAEHWYLGGATAAPSPAECRDALRTHMPELLPAYDRACALIGDDTLAHAIISHYRPAAESAACSQAVWTGPGGPALIRNYDYPLDVVTDRFEATCWFGRAVICKAQRPWGGCLDGMNQDGLAASITFGGSRARARGFSIILVLRYVLETCREVDEAVAALTRIPVALSQNVTLLDAAGTHATLYLGPDRAPAVTRELCCTNHQGRVVWPEHAANSRTVERRDALAALLAAPGMTLDRLIESFLAPPLYSRRQAFPTVYTAVYRPAEGRVDYIWPGRIVTQRIGGFEAGEYTHDYGELVAL